MEFPLPDDEEEENWKCRKHPSQPHNGVCPTCLWNRLVLLCPDCANLSPCACSSAFAAVGPVSRIIGAEPALWRSRSSAFHFLRPRSGESRPPLPPENRRKSSFWSFLRSDKMEKNASGLSRSKSAGISCSSDPGGDVRLKSRSWRFPSSIMAFRQPKMAKVVHQRSLLCSRR